MVGLNDFPKLCTKKLTLHMRRSFLLQQMPLDMARKLATVGFEVKPMRDELYVQLSKQLTSNPSEYVPLGS